MKRLNLAECDRIIDFGVTFLEKMCCWACLSGGGGWVCGGGWGSWIAVRLGLRSGWGSWIAVWLGLQRGWVHELQGRWLGSKSRFANIRAEEMVMGCSAAIVVSLLE
ncbi:unnamed protein product [Prunus armeniaca]|uniref:Uncharacterized protein n=1 Tax=Prunus armeniaca TaxID=36596 RepID=A0A6J5Y0D6_PRUAR|nr:unnamed protein product [Prunus armeniaca]